MKTYAILIVSIILICGCNTTKKVTTTDSTDDKVYLFPLEWIGHYAGVLTIHNSNGDTTQVKMELIIDQPDAMGLYPWVVKYAGSDVRHYGLEAINADKGHYRIDEYNSIKLDGYLRGNHFITKFNVTQNDLLFHYERTDDGVKILVHISDQEASSVTGGEKIGDDTVPNVSSYTIKGFQSAILKKIK